MTAPRRSACSSLPLVCLTAIYFVLNSGLTAAAIGLDLGESPLRIWWRHFSWLSLSYLAAGSVAFCLILLIQGASLFATALVLPLSSSSSSRSGPRSAGSTTRGGIWRRPTGCIGRRSKRSRWRSTRKTT